MAKNDEYELLPHKEIVELRKEIEYLKKHPIGKGKAATNLMDAINGLNSGILLLVDVFRGAVSELPKVSSTVTDEKSSSKVDELDGKVTLLMDQNKQIAEALVAITDMVKTEKKDIDSFKNKINNPRPSTSFTTPQRQKSFIPNKNIGSINPRPNFTGMNSSHLPNTTMPQSNFGQPSTQKISPFPINNPINPIPKYNIPTSNRTISSPNPQVGINLPLTPNKSISAPSGSPIPTPNPMPNYNPTSQHGDFNKPITQPVINEPIVAPNLPNEVKNDPFNIPDLQPDIVSQIDADMHIPEPTGNIIPPPDMTPPLKVGNSVQKPKKGFFSL